jgi:T5SS/PEP-CTERM-associated repeat protein
MNGFLRNLGTAVALGAAGPAMAGGMPRSWTNALGGSFQVDSNWNPLGVPGALDTAVLGLPGPYIVTFSSGAAFELLNASDGSATLALGTFTCSLGGLIVGDSPGDAGTLTLQDGTMSVTPIIPPLTLRIGKDAGAAGTLVLGPGAQLATTDTLLVGDAGSGTVTVSGGHLATALTNLADDAGATGGVTIQGAGSTWTASSGTSVGNNGNGTLLIAGGGQMTSLAPGRVGDNSGSSGTATVTGAGSLWTLSQLLAVGNDGTGVLWITDGGDVSGTQGRVGNNAGSQGTVHVTGAGSTWTCSGAILVGNLGAGTLNAGDGAAVSAATMKVGASAHGEMTVSGGADVSVPGVSHIADLAASSGTLTVSGAGSTATFGNTLFIGNLGSGELMVTSGGSVSCPTAFVGDDPGSSGAVTVQGPGASWSVTGTPFLGNGGSGTLDIAQGGAVTWGGLSRLADDAGTTASVSVDGPGSTWTVQSELFAGNLGTGTISVTNGGDVSTARVKLGDGAGATGTAVVTGAGSTWTDSVEIIVGNAGAGSLTVAAGASASGVTGIIGDDLGSAGTAIIDGPGSSWSSAQQLTVANLGQGTLSVRNGGTATAPVIAVNALGALEGDGTVAGAVTNGGTVRPGLSVGELAVAGSYAQTAGGRLSAELSCAGGDRLAVTGAAQLGGALDLAPVAGLVPLAGAQYTVLTASSVSGTFAAVNSPVAVQLVYGTGTVKVVVLEGPPPHPGDVNSDGTINVVDFLALLQAWGPCPGCPTDVDGDGTVGIIDFLTLLQNWGPACP